MQASVFRGGPVQHMGNHNYIGLSFTLFILLIIYLFIFLVLFSLLITECESYQHSVPKMENIYGGFHTFLFSPPHQQCSLPEVILCQYLI